MIRQKIYLDTLVINFIFADDAPEKKEVTIELFNNLIATGIYETYISDFVVEEINNTTNERRRKELIGALEKYPIDFALLGNNLSDIQFPAKELTEQGVIPKKQ